MFTVAPAAPVTRAHRNCLFAFLVARARAKSDAHSLIAVTQSQPTLVQHTSGIGGFTRSRDLLGVLTQMCQPHLFCVKWKWCSEQHQTLTVREERSGCMAKGQERFFQHWSAFSLEGPTYKIDFAPQNPECLLGLGMNLLSCSYCWWFVFMTLGRWVSPPVARFSSYLNLLSCLGLVVLKGLNRAFVTAPLFQLFITQLCAHCWLHWSILQYSRISS